eukprot:5280019-Amphidinium_carterae.3
MHTLSGAWSSSLSAKAGKVHSHWTLHTVLIPRKFSTERSTSKEFPYLRRATFKCAKIVMSRNDYGSAVLFPSVDFMHSASAHQLQYRYASAIEAKLHVHLLP